jgi:hypothetical protein
MEGYRRPVPGTKRVKPHTVAEVEALLAHLEGQY